MTEYFKITEHNDWEGETWHFYFWVPEDNSQVQHLADHLAQDAYTSESHVVSLDFLSSSTLDVLEEHDGEMGYMPKHNRVEGYLDIEAILALSEEDLARALYKGQVRKFTT